MRIVIDMNLSPQWRDVLTELGEEAVHWSQVGSATATDAEILSWALTNNYVVFTHDLDFGAILASSKTNAPSVVQLRVQDPVPQVAAELLARILKTYREDLVRGALVSVDEVRARVRVLPIR
jgi:predicted nuclease of predicted toxin-antitoxin system